MPEIPVGNQAFDLTFHPTSSTVYVGLLTGEIKAFNYSDSESDWEYSKAFTLRPTKRSCRGLATSPTGDRLYSVSKDKALHTIDTSVGKVVESIPNAHESAINRIARLMPNMLATGDDEGVIKLWDPRKFTEIRAYTHHFDFITDFLWLEDKKHVVATSGDGTLSVLDVRASKTEPFAQSEDQEDELLSIVPFKGNTKIAVGTQLGVISIFNRSAGWGDCVDRVPGHPHSVDTLCALPASLSPGTDVIATGSSDGLIRLLQLLPHKFLGVVADHGEFPIERIRLDRAGEGKWLGSVSHDDLLKLTNLEDALEESGDEDEGEGEGEGDDESDGDGVVGREDDLDRDSDSESDEEQEEDEVKVKARKTSLQGADDEKDEESRKEDETTKNDSDSEEEAPKKKRQKRQKTKVEIKQAGKQVDHHGSGIAPGTASFFSDL
ncbi:hypothetical protein BOTBODRAFT_38752 [Botryobasidium botryosum FD-172 SS1]|uniref:WD repeat-containing protein JIP5 n=1 Tax=Botryobasidium botryosum (strain FD-172 SS1) TaxID=930990 RepID=A0A067M6P3_BOTB1|nr:hypothetical protein BOTBODRAFT_38752 [Botryobasidium botryosum FD-172 SS1]